MLALIAASLLLPHARSFDDLRTILYTCGEVSEYTHNLGSAAWLYAWAYWIPW